MLTLMMMCLGAANLGAEAPFDWYDNACVEQHLRLMKPSAPLDAQRAGMSFDAALHKQAWAHRLLTGAGLSTEGLRIEAIDQGGCRNLGVFAVHTNAQRFVAKRSYRMFEPVRLATLQLHLHCYPREHDVRDRNPGTVWLPGDEQRRARVMPMVAWDYSVPDEEHQHRLGGTWPVMLFERAQGNTLDVPNPNRMDAYTQEEQDAFLRRAYAVGVSLALLQVPSLQGSSRVHVFARAAWMHEDLHMGNMFFDESKQRVELIDCIEMRRAAYWDKDLRGMLLHRDMYPIDHPLRMGWSRAFAEGYLSRTQGRLQDELTRAFSGTLIYTPEDLADPARRQLIW